MTQVTISDTVLREAASHGADSFLCAIIGAIRGAIGGELTASNMSLLNTSQLTLLAWQTVHDEVMDGGFVQLIHNGYGPFIFRNPVAKVLRLWGMRELSKLLYAAAKLYLGHGQAIERDCTDDEFMALFEQHAEFDELDDDFVENEEEWTEQIAHYVDSHIDHFVIIAS